MRATAHFSFLAAAALVAGLLDAILIAHHVHGAGGAFDTAPPRLWVAVPLVWIAIAAVLSLLLVPLLKHYATPLIAFVLAAILIVIRAGDVFHGVKLVLLLAMVAAAIVIVARYWLAAPRLLAARALAVLILLVAAACGASSVTHRRPLVPRTANGPDVIVIVLDTVRYDALFDRDGNVRTNFPTVAKLASQSIVFDRMFASAPWTLPSHLGAFTGLDPGALGITFDRQHYRETTPTLAERFRARGYRTAAIVSNHFLYRGSGFERGFDRYAQAEMGLDVCRSAPGMWAHGHWPWFSATICGWNASSVASRARAELARDDVPLFLFVNLMDAHDPYYVDADCRKSGATSDYAGAIQCVDRELGTLVEAIDERRNRNALVIVVADHGEQFGEHGLVRHGNSLYTQLLHVPLLARAPWLTHERNAAPRSLVELPLLIDAWLARKATPAPSRDVASLLVPAGGAGAQASIVDGSLHCIVEKSGRASLYDLASDPLEARDLASHPEFASDVARMRSRAMAVLQAIARHPAQGDFRSLGYVH